jgi:hypothetical protein
MLKKGVCQNTKEIMLNYRNKQKNYSEEFILTNSIIFIAESAMWKKVLISMCCLMSLEVSSSTFRLKAGQSPYLLTIHDSVPISLNVI